MSGAIVSVEGLSVGYSEDTPILVDVSFEVERGEVFAVLGSSGAGKSTLLRCLVGLDEPLAGEIEVDGEAPLLDGSRPRFGVMFQNGALLGSMTLLENVALPMQEWLGLPPDAVTAMALAKLRLVGLEAAASKAPSELSGGMRKRAAIARAMALEPPLLFLDEPCAGLDPITSGEIDELIATLQRAVGVTVVLVTHELDTIFAIADRCILLDRDSKGIIGRGTPRALAASADERVSQFFRRRTETLGAPEATT